MGADPNPISSTSAKSSIENDTFSAKVQSKGIVNPSSNILSMTIKKKEGKSGKNSGTIEASSYNSLISHQSKSLSNTKNEKSSRSIINRKAIASKKRISSKEESSASSKNKYKATQEALVSKKYSELNVNNEIAKSHNLGFNYKRSSIKSDNSEDTLKSPVPKGSEK